MENRNLKILKEKKSKPLLVIGDIFLDVFSECKVIKVSQEAPVLVLNPMDILKKEYLGGAGNVYNNINSSGSKSKLITLCGYNFNKLFKNILKSQKDIFLIKDKNYKDIKKLRFLSNQKHILRVDYENKYNLNDSHIKKILNHLNKVVKKMSCIVISDYNKGFLTENLITKIFKIAKNNNIKIIVDTKKKDLRIFQNCDIIKVNKIEAEKSFSVNNFETKKNQQKIKNFLKEYSIKNLIITLGRDGFCIFNKEKYFKYKNYNSIDVSEVSGAGDTFLAYFASAFSKNIDVYNSAKIANKAASISVSKYGIASIKNNEI